MIEIFFIVVVLPILGALILGPFIAIFVIKKQPCPRCGHPTAYVIYHAGKTCPACKTRLLIRNGKLELLP